MKVDDIMTRGVETISPDQPVSQAARAMIHADCGAIFVEENDKLVGVITDRDIVIRLVARGLSNETPVRDIMTHQIRYCFNDDDVQRVAENMADLHVRRLPVVDRQKRLVGIISLGNFASGAHISAGSTLLRGVAQAH